MARVNPIVLSQIFKTGANAASPVAAFLVGRKIKEDRESQKVLNDLRQAQIDQMNVPPPTNSPFTKINPADYTQDSVRAFAESGGQDYGLLVPRPKASGDASPFTKINPKDYTPESLAAFSASGGEDFTVLRAKDGKDSLPKLQNFADADGNVKVVAEVGSPKWKQAVDDPNLFATGPVSQTQRIRQENVQIFPETTDQRPEPPQTLSLWDLAEEATGPVNFATGAVEQAGTLAGANMDTPVTEAQQTFATENNNLIRALSINPRFPVAEIKRIRDEIKVSPGFFTSVPVLRGRMRSIDESLRFRLRQAQNDANNPNLPKETRESQAANAVAIQNYLDVLRVPQDEGSEIKIKSRRKIGD